MGVRIFFIAPDFVWPSVRGGHVRVLSQLRVLTSLPEVEYVRVFWLREEPVTPEQRDGLSRAMPKLDVREPVFHPIHLARHPRYVPRVAWLRIAHGVPYVAGKWESPTVRRALEAELREGRFDAVWLGALGTARYLPLVRLLVPRARVVLDEHNVESDIWEQFARRQRGVRRAVAETEWRATRRFEREVLREVDAVGAISAEDARAYRDLAGVEAHYVPQVVPFVARAPAASTGRQICFVGTLNWHPNELGLNWFCEAVWPLVRARLPDATFEIAGSGLPIDGAGSPLAPAAWRAPGVTTLGFLPDLRPLYERAAVMVAPILGGSGVRMKLLEAFQSGVPVVTTPEGARGLAIAPGREAFVEGDPDAFAARVVEVATSATLQQRMREAGYAYLVRHHGLAPAQRVVRVLLGLAASYRPAMPPVVAQGSPARWLL
ncbi:MAG TPA: glycosyltransferase family 4 protein [Candidatus Limnocylindria bacterium]|jgi:glycosyltransferase involved in cell wall biosynthesis|nr:glycosyltransferase family 4 protein [Candidatus Limnocylindria bacterium]